MSMNCLLYTSDVLFDAYNPKTKIPLKILVNKFMISAYSFKRVTIVRIKITSRRMQMCIRDRFKLCLCQVKISLFHGSLRTLILHRIIPGHINIAAVSYTHLDVYKRQDCL